MNDNDILICECYSTEHQVVLFYSEDEVDGKIVPNCYMHVHLAKKPFIERLKYALKYLFGYQCKFGAFDEFIFNPSDAPKIQKLADHLTVTDEN